MELLGVGESGRATLDKGVVTKTTHRRARNIENQAKAMKLAPKGLAPKLISYSKKEIQYEFVKGREPKKLTSKQIVVHAKQLAKLHSKRSNKVGRLIDAKLGRFSLYKALISEWKSYCKEPFASEYKPVYELLKKIIGKNDFLFTTRRTNLTHSDCSLTNMIVNAGKIIYIDWELASFEDAAKDVAGFYRDGYAMKPWTQKLSKKDEELYLKTYEKYSKDTTIRQRVALFHKYHAFIDALYFEWKLKNFSKEQTKVLTKDGYTKELNQIKKYLAKLVESSKK